MLRFAVAGVPLSTPPPGGTVEGLKQAATLGINAMEIEWVQNVPKNPGRMAEIRATAEELDITLTVHAPYYVNLNSQDPAPSRRASAASLPRSPWGKSLGSAPSASTRRST